MSILKVAIWFFLLTNGLQTTDGFRGILPLQSTREEVERVLGSPTESCTEVCHYETKTEGVFVRYSERRCNSSEATPLNIPSNTVVSVTVYPEVKTRLQDLKLNMRKFKRTKDPELNGYSTYTNVEAGITYEVSDKSLVLSIEWFGSAQNIQALRCPPTP
jgi:hypothetical protein